MVISRKTIKMFDERAETYDTSIPPSCIYIYSYIIKKTIEYADFKKTDLVLDIGTGTGALALTAARNVKKIIAIDPSRKMLEVAKTKAKKYGINNINFKCGSFLSLGIKKNSMDVVISNLALHHLNDIDKEQTINLMRDLLRDSGRIVIGDAILFFDPEAEPKKLTDTLGLIKKYLGESFKNFDLNLYSDHHHVSKINNLKILFEKAGFNIMKIEEILPVLGIISAKL